MENNAQNELQRRRQEMFRNMGVANAGKILNESAVAGGGANSDMAAKIAAIKSGAARGAVTNAISAIEGGNKQQFKAIPDSSRNKFAKEQVNPEYSQKVESFDLPSGRSSELAAIESMFGSDGPSRGANRQNSGYEQFAQNPLNTELNIDDIVMPTFNPHAALQQKAMKQQNKNNAQSPYLKFASDNPIQQEQFEDFIPQQQQQQQGINLNFNNLQMMMETIAKGIAEKTIKNVLNEYTEQQKGRIYIEKFDKERNIIKTSDGKYYRVTQVEPKKK